jgi:uncharacterized protein
MIVNVKVKPSSSQRKIEDFGNHRYLVYLTEPPENNRANIELINILAKYFGVPAGHIKIKVGMSSNEKMLEIL